MPVRASWTCDSGYDRTYRPGRRRRPHRLRGHHRLLHPWRDSRMNALMASAPVPVCHVVKGKLVTGADQVFGRGHTRFTTPALDLDSLVWSRREPGPAFETPLSEIMDLLAETGHWLTADPQGLMAEALEYASRTSSLPYPVLKRSYETLGRAFDRKSMEFQVRNELGGAGVLDGWQEVHDAPSGRRHRIRAFPPRLIHIMAGNDAVESTLFRPQFFDKLVAWGGESSLRSAKQYIGPGFELVAFDPKTSISMIGREAFESAATLAEAADHGANDATLVEQQACSSSRFQFVEGTIEQVDRYCALLMERMGVERIFASAEGRPLAENLREEIDGLRGMEDFYRVWGGYEGPGVVIRSQDPVEFHPDGRVVNVVPVTSLADAVRFANVATQTVGVYPSSRRAELRNALAAAGVQRVVELGGAGGVETGLPHDGFFPLQRLVRWV